LQWEIAMFPLLVVQIAGLSLGVGLWMSALTARYRDFTHLTGFLVQLWMYATPIIFPLSMIPKNWCWLVVLNPMTMPVESLKYMFLGQGEVNALYMAISICVSAFVLISGILLFQKVERTFIDSV
jgi:lipopolysaccharide transport system permease protein